MMKRSAVWNFFTDVDANTAKCELCEKMYSKKGRTTTPLKSHLKAMHPEQYVELLKFEEEQSSGGPSQSDDTTSRQAPKIQKFLQETSRKSQSWDATNSRSKLIDKLITEMIAVQDLPFDFVAGTGFRRLMQTAVPNYQMRDSEFYTSHLCEELYPKMTEKVEQILNKIPKLTFTTKIWPASNASLIILMAHGITKDFKRILFVLNCSFSESYRSDILSKTLREVMVERNIRSYEGIHCLLNDTSLSVVKVGNLNDIPCLDCNVQQLQMCIQTALDGNEIITDLISKCKLISNFLDDSVVAQNHLNKIQEDLDKPTSNVIQEGSARWDSTYYMLVRLREMKDSLCLYATQYDLPQISSEEWSELDKLVAILKPIEEITKEMISLKSSISSVIPLIHVLKYTLKAMETRLGENDNFQSIISKLMEEINLRFGELQSNNLYALATYLDPRYKLKFFTDLIKDQVQSELLSLLGNLKNDENDSGPAVKKLKLELDDLEDDPSSSSQFKSDPTISIQSSLASILTDNDDDMVLTDECDTFNKFILWKSLINEYNKENRLPLTEDPLLWWKMNTKYQALKPIARQFLSPPSSSTPNEELLNIPSTIGDLSRMNRDVASKLLFVKYNLPLLEFNY